MNLLIIKFIDLGVGEDFSAVKNTDYSSRRSEFESKHPHSGQQPSGTPVSGDPTNSYVLFGHCMTWANLHVGLTLIYIKKKKMLWVLRYFTT